jgi:type IV secretion system protein VirB10
MVTEDTNENHEYTHPDFTEHAVEPEVERGLSQVAAVPGKNILIMAIIAIIVVVAVYYSFFADGPEDKKKPAPAPVVTSKTPTTKPVGQDTDAQVAPVMPSLPEPPPLVAPTPPPAPVAAPVASAPVVPVPVPVPQIPLIKNNDEGKRNADEARRKAEEAREAARQARRKSGMMTAGGGGGSGGGSGAANAAQGAKNTLENKIYGDEDFVLARTGAAQVRATRLGNSPTIIAQGKVIDAVLETAINTDLPGTLRAVVARDIYAEAGRTILLPKGSRLIGSYQADIKRGQRRVQIVWTRLIRPDGIDIAIDSPASDQLGRAGVDGLVDNRYTELFSSAILLSTISTGFAIVADKASKGQNTTSNSTTVGNGGTTSTSTSTPTGAAIADSVKQIGSITQGITQDYLEIKPTITIDQGTKIIVYVNRDLVFPASISNNVQLVQ